MRTSLCSQRPAPWIPRGVPDQKPSPKAKAPRQANRPLSQEEGVGAGQWGVLLSGQCPGVGSWPKTISDITVLWDQGTPPLSRARGSRGVPCAATSRAGPTDVRTRASQPQGSSHLEDTGAQEAARGWGHLKMVKAKMAPTQKGKSKKKKAFGFRKVESRKKAPAGHSGKTAAPGERWRPWASLQGSLPSGSCPPPRH